MQPALPVPLVPRVLQAQPVHRGNKETLVHRVRRVRKVLQVLRVPPEQLAHKEYKVQQARSAQPAPLVQ